MKRILAIAALALGFASSASAQHSVALQWTIPPAPTGVVYTGFNVYRAPCAGTITNAICSTDSTATFTKLTATALGPTVTTYTDTTVTGGTNVVYYATSLCATCTTPESVPSMHVAATIPANQPPPPILDITKVAITTNGTNETILAQWTDTSGTQQHFAFTDGNLFRGQGITSSLTGTFAETLTVPAGTQITFIVCNAAGMCANQKAM